MDFETTASPYEYNNKTENVTECDFKLWSPTLIILPVLYLLIFILGLCGNGVVIFAVCRAQGKRSAIDLYIGNLAVADLIFVVTLPLWGISAAMDFHWPFGVILCKISDFVTYINIYASVFCLTCMSFDRYLSIVHSRSTTRLHTDGHVRSCLKAIWLLSGLFATPFLVFCTAEYNPITNTTSCALECSLVASTPEQKNQWIAGVNIFSSVVGFLIPFLIMTVCYCLISSTITRHFNILRKDDQRKRRLLKIITSVVVVFAACWMPFHVLQTIESLALLVQSSVNICFLRYIYSAYPFAICLAYLNSCLNPFLYAFFDQRFRPRYLCQKPLSSQKTEAQSMAPKVTNTQRQRDTKDSKQS